MKINNHDMLSLITRLRRFKGELAESVSADVSIINEHDYGRLVEYLGALKLFKGWMVSQPSLDLPGSSPVELELGDTPDYGSIENDDYRHILKLLDIVEIELIKSQSAKKSTGLCEPDSKRFDTYIEKIEKFLTDFIDKTSPMDLPESAANVAV